jgi:hypothetical protein
MANAHTYENRQRGSDTEGRQEQDRLAFTRAALLERRERERLVNRRRRQADVVSPETNSGRAVRCPHCREVLEQWSA